LRKSKLNLLLPRKYP